MMCSGPHRGGEMLLTQSVSDLPPMVVAAALEKVAAFTDFNKANDPHGEHDYLSFDLCNREFVFHIAYYDLTLEKASPDPADPNVTKRVGTLMLTHEW
jgi:Protein of unknown function (DUF3768)